HGPLHPRRARRVGRDGAHGRARHGAGDGFVGPRGGAQLRPGHRPGHAGRGAGRSRGQPRLSGLGRRGRTAPQVAGGRQPARSAVMGWADLFEISLTGLASGGLYALAALAFVMVYKATRVVNIAIGEMLMAGAYLFFTFSAMWALPLWLAIPAAVLASGVLGAVIERTVIRPLLGEPPISVFMVTVGLGSVLVGLVEILWSADQRRLPDFMPTSPIMVGDAFLAPKVFWGAVVAALFIAAVLLLFRYWRGGVALRATASDQAAAYSVGINVPRVFSLAWVASAML